MVKEKLIELGLRDVDARMIASSTSQPEALVPVIDIVSNMVDEYAKRIPTSDKVLVAYNKFVTLAAVVFVGEHRDFKDAVIPQYFEAYVDRVVSMCDYDRTTVDKAIWAGVDIMLKSADPDVLPIVWTGI